MCWCCLTKPVTSFSTTQRLNAHAQVRLRKASLLDMVHQSCTGRSSRRRSERKDRPYFSAQAWRHWCYVCTCIYVPTFPCSKSIAASPHNSIPCFCPITRQFMLALSIRNQERYDYRYCGLREMQRNYIKICFPYRESDNFNTVMLGQISYVHKQKGVTLQ